MAASGLDLEVVIREVLRQHSNRKGCKFRPDAIEWLKTQPSWSAFTSDIELAEIECVEE